MTRLLTASLLVLALFASRSHAQEGNKPPKGFTAIFNGKNLKGWHGMGHFDPRKLKAMTPAERTAKRLKDLDDVHKHWFVRDGELINDGHGVFLTTDKEYGDFEMWIDYKTVPKADSGIYLRFNPQIQIWDYTKAGGKWNIGADKGSGGMWNNSKGAAGKDPLVLADKPFGQWNRFRIRQVGARTTVHLNNKLVVDHATMENFWDRSKPLFRKGGIQLQTHGGEIRWRNVFIREIPPSEANAILNSKSNKGFKSVFNGVNLDGWKGDTKNYVVNEGAIMCKKGHGGNLYTANAYSDFVARLEFQLPPGGNNGLAIRYSGKGNPAYDAMCELQVLDSEHPKYAKLDKRQYHGSAYGISAAHRGFLRKTGEWNFQEVTVKGSTIKVELNGFVILNTDVAKVTKYMANSPHPGKNRKSGYFGFAGHNDPVKFRNIQIKTLK